MSLLDLFLKPKCPYCGCRTVVPTGYSFPYPQYRCTNRFCPSKNRKWSTILNVIVAENSSLGIK